MPREALTQNPLFFVPKLRGLGLRILTSPTGRGNARRNLAGDDCGILTSPYSTPEGESKRSFSVSVGGDTETNPPTELAALRSASSRSPSGGEQKQEGCADNFANRDKGARNISPGGRGNAPRNFCSVIGSNTHSPPEGESKRSFSVSVGGDNRRKSPHGTCRVTLASSRSPSGGEQKQEGRADNFANRDKGARNISPGGRGCHAEVLAKAGG